MSKYLDTLLKIKNGKYGSEWLPELERIEQFVKGNITSQELMQNADDRLRYVVYHTLNKIINYEEKNIRYYIEFPESILFSIVGPWCIRAGKVEEIGINCNMMKTIGPKYMLKYYHYPLFNDNYYIEIVGDFSQIPNGVMLYPRDWFNIISKYPNLVEKIHHLTINNYKLEEKLRKMSLEEAQQRVTRTIQSYISAPKDGEPRLSWAGKKEAQYLPQEVIDSISFVIPKEYITKQQVLNGQFETFEEILNGSKSLESSQSENIYNKIDNNKKDMIKCKQEAMNMYSKYDEMCVMKQVIENYADNQKRAYESTIADLKEQSNNFPLDINSDKTSIEISSLESKVSLISNYRTDYQNALSIVSKLNKATMCYEQGYSPEQLQQGGIAEQRAKEGNKIFYEIKTQNSEYKRIIDEIAYGLFDSHDPHLAGLGMNFDAKAESLEKDFEAGKITKEQLIYYTNMCWSLSQNPNYIEYMSQFQQEQAPQGMHR